MIHRKRITSKDLLALIRDLPQELTEQITSELAQQGVSLKDSSSISNNQNKITRIYEQYLEKIEERNAYDTQEGCDSSSAYESAAV
jgi:hypothetical protein